MDCQVTPYKVSGRALHTTGECISCRSKVVHVASLAQQHSPSREQNEQPDASISLASQERQSGDGLPITGIRAGGQLPFL